MLAATRCSRTRLAGGYPSVESLFGVPADQVEFALLAAVGVVFVGLLTGVVSGPVFLRVGLRNAVRRPWRTLLICAGMSLSTAIIASSFVVGDTLSHTIRTITIGSLGDVDEVLVAFRGADYISPAQLAGIASGQTTALATDDFSADEWTRLREALQGKQLIAGLAPAINELVPAVDGASHRASSGLQILALAPDYPRGLGVLRRVDGSEVSLTELGTTRIYLSPAAAESLQATPGDPITIQKGSTELTFEVAALLQDGGPAGQQAVALLPLDAYQAATGRVGRINEIMVANAGGADQRFAESESVSQTLRALMISDATAQGIQRALAGDVGRGEIRRRLTGANPRQRAKLDALQEEASSGVVTERFKALLGDPEILSGIRYAARFNSSLRGPLRETFGRPVAVDVKRLGVERADQYASALTAIFGTLGLFSIATGALLIVLVFTLLSTERRTEMGVLRAIGVQRSRLVLSFLYEGVAYATVAAALGALGGVLVNRALIHLINTMLEPIHLSLEPFIEPRSLVIAACLGFLATSLTILPAAWWVSRRNIVSAIYGVRTDAAEETSTPTRWNLLRRARLGRVILPVLCGLSLALTLWNPNLASAALSLSMLTLLIGLAGGSALRQSRTAISLAAIVIAAIWLSPEALGRLVGVRGLASRPPEFFFLQGIWLIAAGILLASMHLKTLSRAGSHAMGQAPRLGPAIRLALAYLPSHQLRSAMVMSMFALVVLGMASSATLLAATSHALQNPDQLSGGFDLKARVKAAVQGSDVRDALATAGDGDFSSVGALRSVRLESVALSDPVALWQTLNVSAVDAGFLAGAAAPLISRDPRFGSDAAVWTSLQDHPEEGMIVASAEHMPAELPAIYWLRDTASGRPVRIEAVAVVSPSPLFSEGLIVRDLRLASGGIAVPPAEAFYLRVRSGMDVRDAEAGLKLALGSLDLQTETLAGAQKLAQDILTPLNQILEGFTGIGLLVGLAGLALVGTITVAERRQHIGVLRALGLPRLLVAALFLIESSVIALVGVGLGLALGVILSQQIVENVALQHREIQFVIPWWQLAAIAIVAYGVTLLATLVPALQAARLGPARTIRDGI